MSHTDSVTAAMRPRGGSNPESNPGKEGHLKPVTAYSYPQLRLKHPTSAPGQNSIGTGGHYWIGANRQTTCRWLLWSPLRLHLRRISGKRCHWRLGSGSFDVFDDAVLAGASSNMCDALLGFSGAGRNRAFEITVKQASTPLFEVMPSRFVFDGNHVKVLEKATGYYKGDYVLPDRRLTGHITKLSRPQQETSGVVTIESFLGEVERKVQVELTGDDYHQAVIAHDTGKLVRIEGDVHVKSKSAQLLNQRNFGVIEFDDLLRIDPPQDDQSE